MTRAMLLLLSACAGGAAFAQSAGRQDPLKADAAVPAVPYRSAFEDYKPFREQEIAPWREVNDEVARVGGHVGVMKAGKAAERPGDKPVPSGHPGARQ